MRHLLLVTGLLLTSLATARDKDKGTTVDFDGLTSMTPDTWVKEKPASSMRFYQFKLPKAKDDTDDGLIVIFKGIGGTADQNIDRWKNEFKAPKGKTIDDVSKVTDIKIGGKEAKRLDISEGIFQYNPAPFNPKSKKEDRPGYKMIGIHFDGPDNTYHIKLTGPAKTVDQYAKGFDEWVKGFKK